MLGRTNAGDGGIILNATIEPKEVATGNSITAGDFVNYYTVSQRATIVGNKKISYNEMPIVMGDDLCVFPIRTNDTDKFSLFLCELSGATLTVKDSYNGRIITSIIKYDDDYFFGVYTGNGVGVACYSVSNGAISEVSSVQITTSSSYITNMYYDATSRKIIVGSSGVGTFISVSESMQLSAIAETVALGTNSKYISSDGNKIVIFGDRFTVRNIDFVNNTTSDAIYDSNQFLSATSGQIIGGHFIGIALLRSESQNVIANIDLNTFTVQYKATMGESDYIPQTMSEFYNSNYFAVVDTTAKAVALYRVRTDSYTTELVSNIKVDNVTDYSPVVFEKDGYIYKTARSTSSTTSTGNVYMWTYYRNSTSSVISDFIDTDYVINWDGSGNPIGVAKDSGSAGQTINVYVPSV